MNLHVYKNRVIEWFVAESMEECLILAKKFYIENYGSDENELEYFNFTEEPDDKIMSIKFDPYDRDSDTEKMTCGEFATKYGKGFLCSTEY